MLSNGELCAYCGRAEHALCSSMVVGQTKAEAEWFIKNFMVKSSPANIRSLPLPYLPLINSKDARGITGPHVHEVCARLMLKARIEKAQQTMRHLKRRAIKAAVWFSGFYIEPLGVDRAHRVYYRFPGDTSWVYVYCASKEDFNPSSHHNTSSLADCVAYDASEVPGLLKWLNPQGTCERKLTQALVEAFPEKAVENESSTEQLPQRVLEGSISTVGDDDGGSILIQNDQNEDKEIEADSTEMQQEVCDGHDQQHVIGHVGPAPAVPKRPEKEGNVIHLCEKRGSVLPPTEMEVIHCEVPEVMVDVTDAAVEILEDQQYCIKVVNNCGNQIQLPQSCVVCFEVLFNGHAIIHKELERPNGDDLYHYYFDAVYFKSAGTFKLNFFLLPGPNSTPESAKEVFALNVSQSSTIVQVTKHYSKTGGAAALKRLRAVKYLRRNSHSSCLDGLDFECDNVEDVTFDMPEFEVLRLGLKMVATAMPNGALSEVSRDTLMGGFWSPSIREAWITHMKNAYRCQHLMEALLLLESCVTVNWLQPWYKKIIRLMPGVGSLLRLSTPSAVGLRLFLLDKALLYDKRPLPSTFAPRIPRSTRSSAASGTTTTSTSIEKKSQEQYQRKPFVRNTRTSQAANEDGWELFRASDEEEFEDSDSDHDDDTGSRLKGKEVNRKMSVSAKYKEIQGIDDDDDGYSKSEYSESHSTSNNGSEEDEEYVEYGFNTRKKRKSKKMTYNNKLDDDYESSDENDYESSDVYSVSNAESDLEEDSAKQEDIEGEEEDENGGWTCSTCTFLNENNVARCTVCNSRQCRKASMNRNKKKRNY